MPQEPLRVAFVPGVMPGKWERTWQERVRHRRLDDVGSAQEDQHAEGEGEADRRATLTGSDEVPDGYRNLVEEYYRALARSGNRAPGGN